MMNHPQQQRRMFRGRGGPNDRRLPKHNARRRKTTVPRETNELAQDAPSHADDDDDADGDDDHHFATSQSCSELEAENEVTTRIVEESQQRNVELPHILNRSDDPQVQPPLPSSSLHKEVDHLLQRIQNVQKSMQLSKGGNANPATYKTNVLGATINCVKEWKSIRRHYHSDSSLSDVCKSVSLAIFALIQQALQSGPLQGAKPGYFKRCGCEVASEVYNCLDTISPNKETSRVELCLTEKQADTLEKWKVAANKASVSDKVAPSASVLKKQRRNANKK